MAGRRQGSEWVATQVQCNDGSRFENRRRDWQAWKACGLGLGGKDLPAGPDLLKARGRGVDTTAWARGTQKACLWE